MNASAGNPIPMLLFCPQCSVQHVDEPRPDRGWLNPPHRSHACQACGHIWRPADVYTAGVRAIATKGERDGSAAPPVQDALTYAAGAQLLRVSDAMATGAAAWALSAAPTGECTIHLGALGDVRGKTVREAIEAATLLAHAQEAANAA